MGTGVWTARSPILTLQKGKIIPFLPYRRLHGSSWTQGSHRKDVQVVSFSLARSFRTSPRKAVTSRDPSRVRDWGFPGGPVVNDPVPMQETWVSPPVREEPTRYPYASVMESVL